MKARSLRIALASLLLLAVTPVYAQPTTPQPTTGTVISEVAGATQTLGILTVVILFVLAVLAGIVVFFVVVAWRLGIPLVGAIQKATEAAQKATDARDELQDKLFERLESGDRERAVTADINRGTVKALGDMETKTEAKQGRDGAVDSINKHTDEALKPIAKDIERIIKKLDDDQDARTKRETARDEKVDEAIKELRQLKEAILKGTGELDPRKVPDTPPGTGKE